MIRYKNTLAYQKATGVIAYEDSEQMSVIRWLKIQKIPHTHVANERKASIAYKKKLKALGVSAGFPDLIVFLPNVVLFIELKRAKKSLSRVSANQKNWIDVLNMYEYAKAKVCYGADEAIEFIKANSTR
ncbi:VRR-NUC domain-containing protein [Campylobacter sp. faydin G-24]|uniref:VRR-NUC domain-containing protein n=1 Tax=Campylobacter anatolicus TaxID=2829105 RepID=A0ABS5HKE4_9BACT|nr:VRR-NUC domain-containing protein [Campylobacter anatolicus]MBR8461491.1 VRR-NUC domain-containing protein [Campylobacter anatolicus]MBR8464738.1 VRR-NUC domain-containing protein [Campylobacter anatolicus]